MTYIQKSVFRTEVARALETPVMVRRVEEMLIESIHVDKLATAPIAIRVVISGIGFGIAVIAPVIGIGFGITVVAPIQERCRCVIIYMF